MANAKRPNATYIPLTLVGGFALGDAKKLRHPSKYTQRKWFCVAV